MQQHLAGHVHAHAHALLHNSAATRPSSRRCDKGQCGSGDPTNTSDSLAGTRVRAASNSARCRRGAVPHAALLTTPRPIAGGGHAAGAACRLCSLPNAASWATLLISALPCFGCRGSNDAGILGNGSSLESSFMPLLVQGGHAFVQLSAGNDHTCAVDASAAAWCWGCAGASAGRQGSVQRPATSCNCWRITRSALQRCLNNPPVLPCACSNGESGQLGYGALNSMNVPVAVSGGHRFAAVSAGGRTSAGVLQGSGTGLFWGMQGGSKGDPDEVPIPMPVGNQSWAALEATDPQAMYGLLSSPELPVPALPGTAASPPAAPAEGAGEASSTAAAPTGPIIGGVVGGIGECAAAQRERRMRACMSHATPPKAPRSPPPLQLWWRR